MKIRFNLQYPNREKSLIMAIIRDKGLQTKKSIGVSIPTHLWDKSKQRCDEEGGSTVREKRALHKINKQLDEIAKRCTQVGNLCLFGSITMSDIDFTLLSTML